MISYWRLKNNLKSSNKIQSRKSTKTSTKKFLLPTTIENNNKSSHDINLNGKNSILYFINTFT